MMELPKLVLNKRNIQAFKIIEYNKRYYRSNYGLGLSKEFSPCLGKFPVRTQLGWTWTRLGLDSEYLLNI